MWYLTIYPLRTPVSSLTLVPLSNRYGISQFTPFQGSASSRAHRPMSTPLRFPASMLTHHPVSTPFEDQRPRWHTAQCLALIPFVTTQVYQQILSSQGFKTRLLVRGFHTHIKNVSFPSPTNVGSHRSLLFRAQLIPLFNQYEISET